MYHPTQQESKQRKTSGEETVNNRLILNLICRNVNVAGLTRIVLHTLDRTSVSLSHHVRVLVLSSSSLIAVALCEQFFRWHWPRHRPRVFPKPSRHSVCANAHDGHYWVPVRFGQYDISVSWRVLHSVLMFYTFCLQLPRFTWPYCTVRLPSILTRHFTCASPHHRYYRIPLRFG